METRAQPINLHKQDTEFELIATLIPYLRNKTFLDIGAEKGEFSKFFSSLGLTGTMFEPLPNFADELKVIAAKTKCSFLAYAIDHTDRTADFFVALDLDNNPSEHFSSLHALNKDARIKHKKAATVTCRSLNSLLLEGKINKHIGVVKIDTEGNDLNVMQGMQDIECEILICEYFMPGIYAGWELGHPHGLIDQAKKLGFNHYIAVKRADEFEIVSLDTDFIDKQWGNLIFINDKIYAESKDVLQKFISKKENLFLTSVCSFKNQIKMLAAENKTLEIVCTERLDLINKQHLEITGKASWKRQLRRIRRYLGFFYPSSLLNFIIKKLKKILSPHIGKLTQHPPKPLVIPEHYQNKLTLKNPPSISIVTPSYNQSHFLEKTITSVIEQNYPGLEYIIQDGASADNSLDVIKRYQSHLKHWESVKDRGQTHALNLGFQHATGEIMAYLNSDDMLMPGTLHYIANFFMQHPDIDVVYSHRILIDELDREIGRWILPPHDSKVLASADYIPQETLFWRRRIWEKAGSKLDESFRFAMDWDLLIRFKEAGAKFARLPRFLAMFRVHQQQKTATDLHGIGHDEMLRIRCHCHGRFVSTREINRNIRPYLLKHLIWNKLYQVGVFKY